jgi:flagellar biosynthesis/type III secretory pathway protein FliH
VNTTPVNKSGYCFPKIAGTAAERCEGREASPPAFRRLSPGAPAAACRLSKPRGARSQEQARVDLEQDAYCRGFSDGEKSGFEQGERAGLEAAAGRMEGLLKSLEQMLSDLENLQRRACHDLEKEMVRLALEVARKVVGREVQTDVETVAGIVRDAVNRVEHAEHITIRMNPEDMQRLVELNPRRLDALAEAGRTRFEADASITSGGCRVESDSGDIDARLEQRFKIVEEAFQAEWNKDAAPQG